MNVETKFLARKLFQNQLLQANGNGFEEIFTKIMNYHDPNFQQVKPYGNIGDRKNDGYIKEKGIYYQVYAPESPITKYPDVIKKMVNDFSGLKKHWPSIKEYHFVFNDKYLNVSADCLLAIDKIKAKYSLEKTSIMCARHIEDLLFSLEEDQIITIAGYAPDPSKIKNLNYSILGEVINHIMDLPDSEANNVQFSVPDWKRKIKFNNLTDIVALRLESGSIHLNGLNEYLKRHSTFFADELKNKIVGIYQLHKEKHQGNNLFWIIVETVCPKATMTHRTAAIVILSKYFEACDIFEDPEKGIS